MPPSPRTDQVQPLLDFIYEYAMDDKLFLLAQTGGGRHIELRWDRHGASDSWRLRFEDTGDELQVARGGLLAELQRHGVRDDLLLQELQSVVVAQVVHADMLLGEARRVLGRDVVRGALRDHRQFMGALQHAVPPAAREPLVAIDGGGRQAGGPRGHLRVV